jgi:hypothetical protein
MRFKTLILLTLILLLLGLIGVSTAAALALVAPFHPGQALFSVQEWAEHRYEGVIADPEGRAQFGLTLLERRIDDLEGSIGALAEWDALKAISSEIEHVLNLFQGVPADGETDLRAVFLGDLERLTGLLNQTTYLPEAAPLILANFHQQLLDLQEMAADADHPLAELRNGWEVVEMTLPAESVEPGPRLVAAGVDPRMILFPPGSPGARHLFFPLDGAHSSLSCQSCHAEGVYRGTPELCSDCHLKNRPEGHFEGQCSSCHSTSAWLPASFDHSAAAAVDCQSCHLRDRPVRHYPGECSACHSTNAWKPAAFNHPAAAAVDCQSCHLDRKPANHFAGQCSACHSTDAWKPASFNHQAAGATDCINCHSNRKPANHWSGQCSACHSTTAWKPASFNHQVAAATDCQACHLNRRPANHWSGQCSACHSTNAWKPATFSHQAAGATDCIACHSNRKPANHWSGQCSACHSTMAWKPASFNHQAAGATDCQACHSRPANHFPGQCSECHSTSSWKGASFNHSFPINHGNADGVCSKCHPSGTSSWTCFTCHDQAKMTKKHEEKGIPDYIDRCMECHGDGRKHGD